MLLLSDFYAFYAFYALFMCASSYVIYSDSDIHFWGLFAGGSPAASPGKQAQTKKPKALVKPMPVRRRQATGMNT